MKKDFLLCIPLVVLLFIFLIAPLVKAHGASNYDLIITEIYPDPLEVSEDELLRKEWVELYNPSSIEVDLSVFVMFDNTNKGMKLNGTLKSGEFILIDYLSFGLNDLGDILILKENDIEVDRVVYGNYDDGDKTNNYPKPLEGKSLSRKGLEKESSFLIASPTAGEANIFDESSLESEADIPLVSILEAKKKVSGDSVVTQGRVICLPGEISAQYLYIQDESGGIQIYSYDKEFPALSKGDLIEANGELSEFNGEKRLKIQEVSDIKIISSGLEVATQVKDLANLGIEDIGTKIVVEGIVESPSGSQFTISNGSAKLKILIRNSALVKKPNLKSGQKVEIRGILSVYKDELRLLPFEPESVRILDRRDLSGILPVAGAGATINFINLYLSVHILWTIYLTAKKRHIFLLKKSLST